MNLFRDASYNIKFELVLMQSNENKILKNFENFIIYFNSNLLKKFLCNFTIFQF